MIDLLFFARPRFRVWTLFLGMIFMMGVFGEPLCAAPPPSERQAAPVENAETRRTIVRMLRSSSLGEQLQALALIDLDRGPQWAQTLTDLLSTEAHPGIHGRTLYLLGRLGEPSVLPTLLGYSRDGDPKIRGSAIAGLGELGDTSLVGTLYQFLEDTDPWVRRRTAGALAKLGDTAIAEAMLLDADASLSAREQLELLGFVSTVEARRRLEQAVEDGPWRGTARLALARHDLRALATAGDKVDFLVTALNDSDRGMVRWAIEELAGLRSPTAWDVLEELAESRHFAAASARWALRHRVQEREGL